jgi:chromosome segregation ATPase
LGGSSGAELEAAPVPLPRVLSRAHQALHETEAAILREWEALEAEHQCLNDWRTQLEERTKVASHQFTSERSELERDHKDYKKDLQKVYARELEVGRNQKRLAKKEEYLNQRVHSTKSWRSSGSSRPWLWRVCKAAVRACWQGPRCCPRRGEA